MAHRDAPQRGEGDQLSRSSALSVAVTAVFNLVAGRMPDSGPGYGAVFSIVGSFHVVGFIVILLTVPRLHPLDDLKRFN